MGIGNCYQGTEKNTARAVARDLRISPKRAYEVANAIRGKELAKARDMLTRTTNIEEPIPFRRYNRGVAHRAGRVGPGGYPVKAAEGFIRVLNEAEANAEAKGLNSDWLVVAHVATHRGAIIQGRFKGGAHNTPTTHIEVVVEEGRSKEKKESKQKEEKKAEETRPKPKVQTRDSANPRSGLHDTLSRVRGSNDSLRESVSVGQPEQSSGLEPVKGEKPAEKKPEEKKVDKQEQEK